MTSNGTLVPQEINVVRKLDQCTVSLDGDEATNDKNRGRGSYKEAIQAIELLKKFKVPVLISAVLSKYSLDSVDSLLKEAQRLGCAVSINIPYHSPENGRSALSAMAEDARYKKTITQIIKAKKNGLPVLFSVVTYRYTLQWPTYKIDMDTHRDVNFKGPTCSAGRYFGYIDTNGDFYPCILYNNRDKFKALNCIEDGVQRAWDNCKTHPCSACFIPCYVEYNYLFSLDWRVIRNVWFSGIWRRFPPVIKT
jgi:MoaA/NifB/PqqE/SkfB family radical SAM enzyme